VEWPRLLFCRIESPGESEDFPGRIYEKHALLDSPYSEVGAIERQVAEPPLNAGKNQSYHRQPAFYCCNASWRCHLLLVMI
jgi:hypothetical protein